MTRQKKLEVMELPEIRIRVTAVEEYEVELGEFAERHSMALEDASLLTPEEVLQKEQQQTANELAEGRYAPYTKVRVELLSEDAPPVTDEDRLIEMFKRAGVSYAYDEDRGGRKLVIWWQKIDRSKVWFDFDEDGQLIGFTASGEGPARLPRKTVK